MRCDVSASYANRDHVVCPVTEDEMESLVELDSEVWTGCLDPRVAWVQQDHQDPQGSQEWEEPRYRTTLCMLLIVRDKQLTYFPYGFR